MTMHKATGLYLLWLLAAYLVGPESASGQQKSHQIMAGTQFPVHWGLGYQYNHHKHFSGRVQVGLLTAPYDKFIIYSMEAFGFDQKYSKALDQSFKLGIVGTVNPQYRFGNNYLGVQGQMAYLRGSISLEEAAQLLLDSKVPVPDLSQLPIILPDFSTRSNLFLLGITYGKEFTLSDPRFALRPEIGFTKIIAARNHFSIDIDVLDQLPPVKVYYHNLDERLKSYYLTYGYIPSISLYLVYTPGKKSL